MIEGIQIVQLVRIPDARGCVFHMLKSTDPHFVQFGEIYFSSVYPGVIKAWKRHQRLTTNYACIFGRIKVAMYDAREGSSTRGAVMDLLMGPDEYALAVIPPGVWHGFQGMSHPAAILANCATEPHDPSEVDRLDPASNHVPYHWD
jgi:dTDP-4-dehydrorhamnose 3,5-epimerase